MDTSGGRYLTLSPEGRPAHNGTEAHPFEDFVFEQASPLLVALTPPRGSRQRPGLGVRLVIYPFELGDPAGFAALSRHLGRFADEAASGAATALLVVWRDGPVIDSTRHFHNLVWWTLGVVLNQADVSVEGDGEGPFRISIGRSELSVVGLHPAAMKPTFRFSHPALLVQPSIPAVRPQRGELD